jgi:hypothetical protein
MGARVCRPAFRRCTCGRMIPGVVRHCSTRTCPEYAPTWARDNRRRLRENLSTVRLAVMFSVTAPGADVYPFDRSVCSHGAGVRCSGRIGCRVNPDRAASFNRRAGKLWRSLNRVAKLRADRSTGHRGKLAVRVWEKQKRGLAHVHGVVPVGTPLERAWARAYVEALTELAPSHGFGFVDGWHKVGRRFWPGEQAAAYLSSYFVRGRSSKASITETVLDPDLPPLLVYVSRDLTRTTGCTMRNLRRVRRLWAVRCGIAAPPEWSALELARVIQLQARWPSVRAP